MLKKLKGLFAFAIYGFLIIYMFYYIDSSEKNSPAIFLYVFFFLGGSGIINFFSGRLIQKLGNMKTFFGRFLYTVATCLITFLACYLFSNHFGYTWNIGEALHSDTYIIVILSTLGFFIGEIYQYKKDHLSK
ncbi:hypothetical protein [Blautia sp. Marseille-P3201T]|uniref:hypothetical protein n=1 Tax=Blautia sp. Marseille-P3201T TaxID=1907659 RepID=UPI0009303743|nr:hypothetical protein [Blautia sp. Marseille-P3201T]